MSLTPSSMLPLSTIAPDFTLLDTITGKMKSLSSLQSDVGTVVMFICNHCPYVIHVHEQLVHLSKDYQEKGIQFIAISANDAEEYPEDSPENMKHMAEEFKFPFPYLYDESQDVAKAYQAACTPDFYIFNGDLICVYRGRLDDSSPGNDNPVTGNDIRAALDNLMAGKTINPEQTPSVGCNIKWKE